MSGMFVLILIFGLYTKFYILPIFIKRKDKIDVSDPA